MLKARAVSWKLNEIGGENGMVCGVGQVHRSGDLSDQRYAEAGEGVSRDGQCAGCEDSGHLLDPGPP